MFLIDTSVWISYFREEINLATKYFSLLLERKLPFGICGVIYQEILQGAATLDDFKKLDQFLSTQQFFYHANNINSYRLAAKIYFEGRRKGITIRSTIDCLIAQIAIENKLTLLHNDKDFNQISKIIPTLKLAP